MENVTKGLLISAAVLVAIVIISFGFLLLKNSNNSTQQSQKVGNDISEATDKAFYDIKGVKLYNTNEFKNKMGTAVAQYLNSENVKDEIVVTGFIYKKYTLYDSNRGIWDVYINTCLEKRNDESDYERSQRIVRSDIYYSSDFVKMENVYNWREETKKYLEKNAEIPTGTTRTTYAAKMYYHYDNNGFIDEIVVIGIGRRR